MAFLFYNRILVPPPHSSGIGISYFISKTAQKMQIPSLRALLWTEVPPAGSVLLQHHVHHPGFLLPLSQGSQAHPSGCQGHAEISWDPSKRNRILQLQPLAAASHPHSAPSSLSRLFPPLFWGSLLLAELGSAQPNPPEKLFCSHGFISLPK